MAKEIFTGPNYQANNTTNSTINTLEASGNPPETRVGDGSQAYQIWQRLWQADTDRSKRRTLVKGLVDGNPPYNPADLAAAGQAHRANVNWGDARSLLENGSGAFYDLFNEAPTYATVRINKGTPEEQDRYSQVVTEHYQWLLRGDSRFDYNMQRSQEQMTLYGCGPMVFQDEYDFVPRSVLTGALKVPEWTLSDTNYWEYCTIEIDYRSDELWRKIMDEKSAKAVGWNVSAVKQAIMNASPSYIQGGLYQTWEWHQQQLKNGSLFYADSSKMICVVHLFFQEFAKDGEKQGKISQVIVNRDQAAQEKGSVFLFQKIGRYKNWNECVHPLYYDRGGGGFHHSVTGLGVKMYPALAFNNRLKCATADKAFAPKLAFRTKNASTADESSLVMQGDCMIIPEFWENVQTPTGSYIEDGVAFAKYVSQDLMQNISAYRPQTVRDDGNPPTATQVRLDASSQAQLSKTQNVRYYMQLDAMYSESYKRAVESGTKKVGFAAKECQEFVERCVRDGVPKECLSHIEWVRATRVIGQGSEFLRQQSLEFLWINVMPVLNETGRQNLLHDLIASKAGQHSAERYAPMGENPQQQDQYGWAVSQVAQMKVGLPSVVAPDQNPIVFLGVFLHSATQAIQSLQQGANPAEVVAFLDLCGQAITQHLARIDKDPSRKQMVKTVEGQLKQIAQVHDQLAQQIQQQQQEQAMQQQQLAEQAQAQQSEMALKWQAMQGKHELQKAKTQFQIQNTALKTQAGLQNQAAKVRQELAVNDVKTAQEIRQKHQQHVVDTAHTIQTHQNDMQMEKESSKTT